MSRFLCILLFLVAAAPLAGKSVYPLRPDDPHAAYLQPGTFGCIADGHADDTTDIHAATEKVQETTARELFSSPMANTALPTLSICGQAFASSVMAHIGQELS